MTSSTDNSVAPSGVADVAYQPRLRATRFHARATWLVVFGVPILMVSGASYLGLPARGGLADVLQNSLIVAGLLLAALAWVAWARAFHGLSSLRLREDLVLTGRPLREVLWREGTHAANWPFWGLAFLYVIQMAISMGLAMAADITNEHMDMERLVGVVLASSAGGAIAMLVAARAVLAMAQRPRLRWLLGIGVVQGVLALFILHVIAAGLMDLGHQIEMFVRDVVLFAWIDRPSLARLDGEPTDVIVAAAIATPGLLLGLAMMAGCEESLQAIERWFPVFEDDRTPDPPAAMLSGPALEAERWRWRGCLAVALAATIAVAALVSLAFPVGLASWRDYGYDLRALLAVLLPACAVIAALVFGATLAFGVRAGLRPRGALALSLVVLLPWLLALSAGAWFGHEAAFILPVRSTQQVEVVEALRAYTTTSEVVAIAALMPLLLARELVAVAGILRLRRPAWRAWWLLATASREVLWLVAIASACGAAQGAFDRFVILDANRLAGWNPFPPRLKWGIDAVTLLGRAPLWLAIIAISIGAPVVSLCLWRWWATVERLRAAARD